MTMTEKDLRIQLAACYRIFDHLGWAELIYNHITAKIPGEKEAFLINPYGLHYSEVTASSLVKVDINGETLEETEYSVNPAGMVIHTAIHGARPDVLCIAHTHTDTGMAVSCQKEGLRTDNFYSILTYNKVAYHDFEGLTVRPDEKVRLVQDIGDKNLVILRNHGLLTCGASIPHAFLNLWFLQRACDVQVAQDSTGKPLTPIPDRIGEMSQEVLQVQMGGRYGEKEFAAMVRKIDRIDPSYKD